MGVTSLTVRLKNRSAHACLLRGRPGVAALTATGEVIALNTGLGGPDPGRPGDMAPGQVSTVDVGSWDSCPRFLAGHHVRYARLRLSLPSSGSIDVDAHGLDLECGIWASRFAGPLSAVPPVSLVVTMYVPASQPLGPAVAYKVTLTNRSSTPYAFSPCPVYEEYIHVRNGFEMRNYRLNCAARPSIPAHGSVTYAMRLPLPKEFPSGPIDKMGWLLSRPSGVGTATANEDLTN